ncbi:MAG: hypothetical protein ACYSU1_04945 [Planctomycetota bacterium]|jgi:hypothetical protein
MRIYYHRDFDGMASAAILADALETSRGEQNVRWAGVNFDRTLNWEDFAMGQDFAVVDFHFHPRARYWFDHHPTTFLREGDADLYTPDENRCFDPEAPSCPPIILRHAQEKWGYEPPAHFAELSKWSDIIDAARFGSADQALFGTEPAIRVSRALTCAPDLSFHDKVVGLMRDRALIQVANDNTVNKCYERSCRNRDNALENFGANIQLRSASALFADLRSRKIRRERFAPFYLNPEIHYAVTLLPTRAGVHITVANNPWNRPKSDFHLGNLMKEYGGGGHQGVGGCNPPDESTAVAWAHEIYHQIENLS